MSKIKRNEFLKMSTLAMLTPFNNNFLSGSLPAISKKDFFDYEAKYTPGVTSEVTPADISGSIRESLETKAAYIYRHLNCRGVVRMDFIFHEEKKEPYLLEINTVPGQSEASIVPQQVKANGWTLKDFYSKLIEECF